ncbi:tetratricopeptide repeat protein [Pedobacter helvus]|uniref:Tetratricopeptide repeat protein n=1 Tax=Pedobacter helvus TaxID=2563444 RepID=A0ABW9JI51_9SPHI|nr:tetratricopeptide repeat protein [Pedobacter ureilyticus]
MRKIILLFLLFISKPALAQNAAAKLKFEEAETAFNNGNYTSALSKLDEVDQLAGIMSKSLYLRIATQQKLFDEADLYDNHEQKKLLASLQKNGSAYLKAMQNEELDDKYREVNAIHESLKYYPSKEAIAQMQQQIKNWENMPEYAAAIKSAKDRTGFDLLKEAVNKGNVMAMMLIGRLYSTNLGFFDVKQDHVMAMNWYKKAADLGFAPAQYEVGNCYYFGNGVEKNYVEALKWYHLAANKGNAQAMKRIADCYFMALGMERDVRTAYNWFLKSANNGESEAMLQLARFYQNGIVVPINAQKSGIWKERAENTTAKGSNK